MKKQKWMHITKQSKRKYYRAVIITKKRCTHMKNQCKLKKVKMNRRNIKSPTHAFRIEVKLTLSSRQLNNKNVFLVEFIAKLWIWPFLMAITGARYSDLINMTRKDLNKGIGIIHLPGSKTKHSKRDIEVNPEDI